MGTDWIKTKLARKIAYILIIIVCLGVFGSLIVLALAINSIQQGHPYPPTPLHEAAFIGDINTVKLYLNSPSEINKLGSETSRSPDTPLSLASSAGHKEIAELLIEHGADLNLCSPINCASACGHIDIVKLLLEKGAKFDKSTVESAIESGNVEIIKLLIEHGFDIKNVPAGERSVLHYASLRGRFEVVKFLVKSGADINLKDSKGMTASDLASAFGYKDIVEFLAKSGAAETIFSAITNGDVNKVSELITDKDIINQKDFHRQTPLYYSVMYDSYDIAQLLIFKGADVNMRDSTGQSPLHLAAQKNRPKIAKLLIDNGAKIDMKDNYPKTPLLYAAEENNLEVSKVLIENGCDVNAEDDIGCTSLHYTRDANIAKLLIEKGADVNKKDNDGITPLCYAVFGQEPQMVDLLVRSGSDVNIKVKTGVGEGVGTCLLIAVYGYNNHPIEYKKIIEALLQNGADPNIKDNFGQTPLDVAKSRNNQELIDLFKKSSKKN